MNDDKKQDKKSFFDKAKEWVKEKWNDFMDGPKWGKAHAGGMARQGLAELRGAFYVDSNIAQQTDYGIYGKATPGETTALRKEDSQTRDAEQGKASEPVQHPVSIEPSVEIGVAEPARSEAENVTSWGNSRLEKCNQELSARQSVDPNRDDLEVDR